ncbi:hypothetical protein ACFLSQ_05745 [Bacteroidota bacterium]
MRKFIIFIMASTMILCFHCCDTEYTLSDNGYVIYGTVTDKITGNPIEGVHVGIKNPNIPDSLIFFSDSVNISFSDGFISKVQTDTIGKYYFSFFMNQKDTNLYFEMFAYMPGYRLWKYKEQYPKVKRITEMIDEINIILL